MASSRSEPAAPGADPGVIQGDLVALRPLTEADRPRIRAILSQPSVAARWWLTQGLERTLNGLFSPEDEVVFAILADDLVVGAIQYAEETDSDYRHASIDVFVDETRHGRGLGTDAVRTLAMHLIRDRGHHRVTIDPAADNERAIRAYAKVGFRPVGVMRQYERGSDGTWHDGLLMDLLADDVT